MALEIGSIDADSGMSQAIYEQMDLYLSPPLQDLIDDAEADAVEAAEETLAQAREGWKKLSYCIAFGVIGHIKADASVALTGSTEVEDGHDHDHDLDLTGVVE